MVKRNLITMNRDSLQLLILGFMLGAAPQFLTASNLADLSEVKSAIGGAFAVAIAGAAKFMFAGGGKK